MQEEWPKTTWATTTQLTGLLLRDALDAYMSK